MENSSRVDFIFPMPVYQIDDYFINETKQSKLVEECYKNPNKNHYGNVTSEDRYILNKDYMAEEKQYFSKQINIFAHDVLLIKPTLNFNITQSWLNINETDTSHHMHYHTNSFISGVYYLTDGPPIVFYKRNETMQNFDFDFKEMNGLNTHQVELEIKKGRLILFPSVLTHEVKRNLNNEARISLSFNTFFKGTLHSDGYRSTDLTI